MADTRMHQSRGWTPSVIDGGGVSTGTADSGCGDSGAGDSGGGLGPSRWSGNCPARWFRPADTWACTRPVGHIGEHR
ncbi:MAG: hypothetical protein M0013_09240, partial [Actinomycetota bacterium]|nr:hypothetical protein [Actinomycetota bacterium]